MKIGTHHLSPVHGYAAVQMRIGAESPRAQGSIESGIEMHDLGCCMHTGIRAARTIHSDRFAGDATQCPLELSLYRVAVWLALPTTKAPAVILDCKGYTA